MDNKLKDAIKAGEEDKKTGEDKYKEALQTWADVDLFEDIKRAVSYGQAEVMYSNRYKRSARSKAHPGIYLSLEDVAAKAKTIDGLVVRWDQPVGWSNVNGARLYISWPKKV